MKTESIVAFLRQQQKDDGSFEGKTSPTCQPFTARRKQPTIFPAILILDCLHNVVGAEDIRLRAAKYLEQQVSKQGSWNYWEASSDARQQQPYPDDLDDTACAFAALMRADASWVNGYRVGQFARLLVAAEQRPGGPYNTWLIDTARAPQWQQIDTAVNANIGYALSLQSVHIAGLTDYLETALTTNTLQSAYYVGEAPVLYFMSRWYHGAYIDTLRSKIAAHIVSSSGGTALERALLLTAGCNAGLPRNELAALAHTLQASVSRSAWPAAPLYIDPAYNNQQHYGGSKVLTSAFALEALTAFASYELKPAVVIARKRGVPRLMTEVREDAKTITSNRLRHRYLATARRVMQDVAGEQITAPASLMAQAGHWQISPQVLNHLNLGSLCGWMAYTLYDDVLDSDGHVSDIGVANIALRRSLGHFTAALPDSAAFTAYVANVFDTIDSANDWEQQHARSTVRGNELALTRLPDYGDLSQLADRSLGHSLAACGVLVQQYGSLDHPQIEALQCFFKYFLIARQLNDDAHDWEADLRAGRITAVVSLLLAGSYRLPYQLAIDDELDRLRLRFWQQTITQVSERIAEQISLAKQALATLDADSAIFMNWLDALEASVGSALQGRNEAVKFIKAYKEQHA
jgi:hypothetical protein